MDILTDDIISLIATGNFPIITCLLWQGTSKIIYRDENGNYHRINGPATIYSTGDWAWYFHGKLHRLDQTKPTAKTSNYYHWYNMVEFLAYRKKIKIEFFWCCINECLNRRWL